MQPIVGIICEYDPFHLGHARQFALIKAKLPNARILCVMSGCFTQRGSAALFPPAFRAHAALRAGASMVLELPCAFALRDAENFALGGVSLLHQLGFVTHLSFGMEDDALPFATEVAALLENPSPIFTQALHAALATGKSFAAAQAQAVACAYADSSPSTAPQAPIALSLQDTVSAAMAKPNNILGICYLRALRRLGSTILPLPVKRIGDYHASSLAASGFPSASATRKAFLAGDTAAAEAACGYPLTGVPHHRPEALDTVLLHKLRSMSTKAIQALPDCSEGLENRIAALASRATTRASLLTSIKTRRYARARLNRLLSHALLDMDATLLANHPQPHYARLLGFRKADEPCLAALRHSGIRIIAKAAHGDMREPLYALDHRAYDLWALGAGLPAGLMMRQEIVIE